MSASSKSRFEVLRVSTLLEMHVVRAVMRWYQRGSFAEEAALLSGGCSFVMKPSRYHRQFIASISFFSLAVGGATAVIAFPYWELSLGCWILSAIPAVAGVPTFTRAVTVTPSGMSSFSPFSGLTAVEWPDVISVRFRTWGQTIRIRNRNGRTIVIPIYMSGLKMLEREFGKRLPVYVWVGAFNKLKRHLASI